MFVGREKELQILNKQYESGNFEFTVLYGRRRIGKTQLLKEFIKDKNSIYYMAIEAGYNTNLNLLSKNIYSNTEKSSYLSPFPDFNQLFNYISDISKDRRLVLIIDEYPYLAQSAPEISSIIQNFCDHEWKNTKLHLVLCGSSMSFMENQVLGIKSPLYGRRTAQIKLKPFTFFETEKYLYPMQKEDIAILHTATGGIAEYLTYIDTNVSLKENLISLFLKDSGRLYEEPINFLKQELREPNVYHNILNAIANGSTKNNTIATKISIQSGALNRYLDNLIELGIIIKEFPVNEDSTRKSIYRIADGSFKFWYQFVLPNMSAIELGLGENVYNESIKDYLNSYMGEGFEKIFYDYFDKLNQEGKLPALFTKRGRWWGNNPNLKREEEIDLIGISKTITLFAEVKWNKDPIDLKIAQSLIEKSLLLKPKKAFYILFSKNGFTESVQRLSREEDNIELISFLDY